MVNDPASILIVDDDEDTCELLPLLLQMNGDKYDITACSTLAAAKAMMDKKRFDLFILDYWMSRHNGTELCRDIRNADPITPIVMYSALSQQDVRNEALGAGANLFLVKPNDMERLTLSVKELLKNRPVMMPDPPRMDVGGRGAATVTIMEEA